MSGLLLPGKGDSTPLIRILSIQVIQKVSPTCLFLDFFFSNTVSRIKLVKRSLPIFFDHLQSIVLYPKQQKRQSRAPAIKYAIKKKKERREGDKRSFMPLVFDSFGWSNALSKGRNNLWLFSRQRWDLRIEPAQWMSVVVFWLEACGYSNLALLVSNSGWTGRLLWRWLEKVKKDFCQTKWLLTLYTLYLWSFIQIRLNFMHYDIH